MKELMRKKLIEKNLPQYKWTEVKKRNTISHEHESTCIYKIYTISADVCRKQ